MRSRLWILLSGYIILSIVHSSPAFGIAGTDKVATKGQHVTMIPGWPEGVDKVINDPVRANGWHHWFSECPNDTYSYEMEVRNTADVNRLLEKLAAIQSEGMEICLDPTKASTHGNNVGAVFTLGNQAILNIWFFNLKLDEMGVRRFGLHRYVDPPAALPPTLFIYVGHPAIDLKQLVIPSGVEVTSYVSAVYKKDHPKDLTVSAIEAFVATHKRASRVSHRNVIKKN